MANAPAFSASLDWALRIVLLVAVPATAGLVLCARPLLFSLFQYDQFSVDDVEMTSRSLATYSFGITGFIAARVLLSGFTARRDYRTPFRFGVIAIGVNLLASAALAYAAAPLGWGHAALGLGTSLAGLLNSALLLRELVRLGIYRPPAGWGRLLLQTFTACTVMGVLLVYLNPGPAEWRDWHATERLTHLGLLVAAGMFAYASCLWSLGLRPRHLQLHPTA
jgi:putative peptidoglycan lipid II flippase